MFHYVADGSWVWSGSDVSGYSDRGIGSINRGKKEWVGVVAVEGKEDRCNCERNWLWQY